MVCCLPNPSMPPKPSAQHVADRKYIEGIVENIVARKLAGTSLPAAGGAPTMLLVSNNLPLYEELIRASLPSTTIVAVDYNSWTLPELKEAIDTRAKGTKFASVGLIDHGKPGEFCLLKCVAGGSVSTSELGSSPEIQAFFKDLAKYVSPGGRIDLMACSVAQNDTKMVDELERITGVTVAASSDMTGGATKGGDWVMETIGKDVSGDYFEKAKLARWQETAFIIMGALALGAAAYAAIPVGTGAAVAGGVAASVTTKVLR